MFHYTIKSIALPGDLSTPVSTYLKVRDLFAQSALMESSDYHGSENNRSFIGLEPLASFSATHGRAIMLYPDKTEHQGDITDSYSVSDAFDDFIKMFSVEGNDSAYCGLYGYTSFNAVRYFEHIDVKDSKEAKNDAPDIHYIMYKYLLVFNDFSSELKLLEMLADGESSHADEIVRAVMSRNYATYTFHAVGPTTSPLTDEEHKANIRRGIAHCKRGDVFQIVLSRRFIQHYEGDDFELYRALRRINPSPYLFYFDFGGFRIFGSSPETHCRIEDNGMAYIDPIAGTTRRQGNTEADAKAAAALLYAVSSASVTGAQQSFSDAKQAYFNRLEQMHLNNPQLVGFGISNRATREAADAHTAGVIVGSKFVTLLAEKHNAQEAVTALVEALEQ